MSIAIKILLPQNLNLFSFLHRVVKTGPMKSIQTTRYSLPLHNITHTNETVRDFWTCCMSFILLPKVRWAAFEMENVLTVGNLATSNPLLPQKVQQIGVCWRQLNAGNIFLIMQDAWAWHPSRKTRISGRGARFYFCLFVFFWLCFDLPSIRLRPPSLVLLLWRGLPGVSRGHTNRRE